MRRSVEDRIIAWIGSLTPLTVRELEMAEVLRGINHDGGREVTINAIQRVAKRWAAQDTPVTIGDTVVKVEVGRFMCEASFVHRLRAKAASEDK